MANGKLVMVVDDDETIREFVEWALSDEGYEVQSASDGAAALGILEGRRPDLILLDMRMPVMDGWSFARAYRDLPGRHAPIVVLTATRNNSDPASEIGAEGFLGEALRFEGVAGNRRSLLWLAGELNRVADVVGAEASSAIWHADGALLASSGRRSADISHDLWCRGAIPAR